ncbi:uncharacterized protein LOC116805794 [Drosophila grimshawi]|uniref:uncharacterized protein LOC116805794 n=1 Tax=Drosophila grimshawi TaxID=7222 RepID=UPI0013EF1E99|nr:uncharacterized protein LOC116805794 [Drosophila grimshawi]
MSKTGDDIIKRAVWEFYHEKILLDMWEENVPLFKSPVHKNSKIYKKMAIELAEAGLKLHWSKIKIKLDNLVRKYKTELSERTKPDASSKRWLHFKKMHQIMSQLAMQNADETEMMCKNESDADAENHNVVDDAGNDVVDDAGNDVVDDAGNDVVDDAGNDVVDDNNEDVGDNVADADDNVSETDSNNSFIVATSEESFHGDFSPTTDEPPAKRNKSTKNPKMTSFELAMVEIARGRTDDLNRAAMTRLKILNRMASDTANYHAKMLEMLAKCINS